MEHSPNIAVVRRLYEARGNGDIVKETLHDDVRWEAAPGMPYGGVHLGFDTPLVGDFRDWVTAPDEWFEVDDRVIVLGHYEGAAIKTGKPFKARFARFAHFWTMRDNKIACLQQIADTVQLARALGP